jgi:hypothetical protein
MRTTLLLLVLLVGRGVTAASAQTSVSIHLTSHQTCEIVGEEVPCADVGAKLLTMHVPLDSDIHMVADFDASYRAVSAALTSLMDSLRNAGYRPKLGYVTTGSE